MQTQLVGELDKPLKAVPDDRSMAEEDEATLVAAAQSGVDEAFETLLHRYRAKLLRTAERFTRNESDAEDIVQQSFQKAFLHLHQFKGRSSFSTWLTRIAINQSLMWLRRRASAVEIPLEQSSADSLEFPDSGLSPEDRCVQEEEKELLFTALNQLTPRVRRAIELREIRELSTREAAHALGVSVQSLKGRVFHGRKKLQTVMKNMMSRNYNLRPSLVRQALGHTPNGVRCHFL